MAIQRVDAAESAAAVSLLSAEAPRLIFKHSPRCGISAMAFTEVSVFAHAHPDLPVFLVDVIAQRALSQQIARELGVPHESPQLIFVVAGQPHWTASHGDITAQAIERLLSAFPAFHPGTLS